MIFWRERLRRRKPHRLEDIYMAVVVNFVRCRGIEGAYAAPIISEVRIREDITVPGTTTNSIQDGEVIMVVNNESNAVAVAVGTAPNADAIESSAATSAGFAINSRDSFAFYPPGGAKVNVKAVA